jgi:hypothetical protein
MDNSYAIVMTSLNEEALIKYVHEPEKYVPEAIEAAIEELKKRGKVFSEEELAAIKKVLDNRKQELEKQEVTEQVLVQAPPPEVPLENELPEYYSEISLYIVAILFNPLFASILLVGNLKRAGKRNGIFPVLAFGILYTMASSMLTFYSGLNIFVYLLLSVIGALILHQVFWNKYLGKNVKYRRRPLWQPVLVFLIITIVLSFLLIFIYYLMGIKPSSIGL